MCRPLRISVIHGGTSTEHDVSLASGRGIVEALLGRGLDVAPIVIGRDGSWTGPDGAGRMACIATLLASDVAIPALHGEGGEDGTIQGLLDTLGVPYVGSGVRASAVCLDKNLTKLVLERAGLATAPGVLVPRAEATVMSARALVRLLDNAGVEGPWFVKPHTGGSSIGVSRVESTTGLAPAVQVAAALGDVLIERELVGREIDVPVLQLPSGELRVGPSLQIHSDPHEPFFSEAAKYSSGLTHFVTPAPLSDNETRRLDGAARLAFQALGCAGLARVDFFLTDDGPVVNEVNTFPGFTPASQFPRMWAAAGLSYPLLVETLVATALGQAAGPTCRSAPKPA